MEFIIAAVTLGFLGSFHCVGMCGPIALALPLNRQNSFTKILSGVLYNSGRILTYGFFGLFFGLLGKGFIISGYQQALSITIGILILIAVIANRVNIAEAGMMKIIFPFISKLKSSLSALFKRKSFPAIFSIGVLNGFLPCGLVYLGIAGAIATGDALKGSLFMMMFGAGTLPAMLFISLASQLVNVQWRNKIRKVVPVFVVLMAGMLILRGMNLGIPYLSPEMDKTDCTKHQCCYKK